MNFPATKKREILKNPPDSDMMVKIANQAASIEDQWQ
jgi:hypothetical protein